jgi:DNA gyrase inhibitor GyrI
MIFKIEQMPATRIVYMRQVGPYSANNYTLMAKFKEWARTKELFTKSSVILGISHDNPQTTSPENCRYDVCMVITDVYKTADNSANEAELSGGKYAVFTIPHTTEAVQKAWSEIFPQLKARGLQLNVSRPIIERYIPAMVDNHLCEICVPV